MRTEPTRVESARVAREIVEGHGLTLEEAAALMPHGKRGKLTLSCVWRWCFEGVLNRGQGNGTRTYLECSKLGGKWMTSKPAMARFMVQQTSCHYKKHAGKPCR